MKARLLLRNSRCRSRSIFTSNMLYSANNHVYTGWEQAVFKWSGQVSVLTVLVPALTNHFAGSLTLKLNVHRVKKKKWQSKKKVIRPMPKQPGQPRYICRYWCIVHAYTFL